MRKFYLLKCYYSTILLLIGVTGCHQEPLVPTSAIPPSCRISQLINVNENTRDTTAYAYNTFGQVERSTFRRWVSGQLINNNEQNFFYSADHYLINQVDRNTTRSANGSLTKENRGYSFEYEDEPKRIRSVRIYNDTSNETYGFREYTYEGDKLKTYTETDPKKIFVRRYTYDGNGKLIQFEESNAGTPAIITNGKIVQRIFADGTTISYEFDNQGQLTKQNAISINGQSIYTYSYDSKPYWNKTQLLLRGIPSPNLGDNAPVHNLLTYNYQQFQNGKLLSNQKLTYSHAYNKEGYSLGYGRSDGARQVTYYSNCP